MGWCRGDQGLHYDNDPEQPQFLCGGETRTWLATSMRRHALRR
jgi:hypothetical protein